MPTCLTHRPISTNSCRSLWCISLKSFRFSRVANSLADAQRQEFLHGLLSDTHNEGVLFHLALTRTPPDERPCGTDGNASLHLGSIVKEELAAVCCDHPPLAWIPVQVVDVIQKLPRQSERTKAGLDRRERCAALLGLPCLSSPRIAHLPSRRCGLCS